MQPQMDRRGKREGMTKKHSKTSQFLDRRSRRTRPTDKRQKRGGTCLCTHTSSVLAFSTPRSFVRSFLCATLEKSPYPPQS
mmetsp:Transcript_46329/g.91360  ORF Transcript_46329/g.91360 Transcript_46329/m.91360 type:complete len:81 (+) Transcript_46329:2512-2754(+)